MDEDALARVVEAVLAAEGSEDAEVGVRLVGEDAIRALNRAHRSQDAVTDVLSFPIDESEPLPTGLPRLLGDVVICLPQAARQAPEAGVTPARELAVLAVHGALHLLGYDHERDAGEMLERQDAICAGLGEVAWAPRSGPAGS